MFTHKQCNYDNECQRVSAKCTCSCGGAINKASIPEHKKNTKLACANYKGPVCDMYCRIKVPVCLNNQCKMERNYSA